MKLCVNCANFVDIGSYCRRPNGEVSPVTGEARAEIYHADTERLGGWFFARLTMNCGREARFFIQKEPHADNAAVQPSP